MLVLKSDLFIEFVLAFPRSDISSIYNPLVKFSKMLLSYLILTIILHVNFPGSCGHEPRLSALIKK